MQSHKSIRTYTHSTKRATHYELAQEPNYNQDKFFKIYDSTVIATS